MKPEIVRARLKRDMQHFLEHRQWYNEIERENVETCEKFLLPVNGKYELMNAKNIDHGKKVKNIIKTKQ